MPTVSVNGIDLYYVEVGTGEPLLLVTGFGADHLSWGFQLGAFSAGHRVIAFDNRGAGRSSAPDLPYTTKLMADDAVALMDRLGIESAHVLGVSLGGMIAQEVALAHPARVRSLQLHATAARPDRYVLALLENLRTVRGLVGAEAAQRATALWLFAATTFNQRPEFVETMLYAARTQPYPQSDVGFARQGDAIVSHDALDRLGAITCPTLVGVGDEDALAPLRFSREIVRAIPHAELHTIAGAGHVAFWEKPAEFNALCLEFLAKHRRRE
jgi:pimeloyl-ACP methyl ester carboxylesterase